MKNLEEILHGCKKKDPVCQEKLYHHFYPALYTLCKTFFNNDHDIISALNNGMLRVFSNMHKYDSTKGNFYSWVHAIVRNAALTYLRDNKTWNVVELSDITANQIDEISLTNFKWEELFKLLSNLPTDTRAVVVLFYLEAFSIKEISSILTIKEGTVKWHLSEGRKILKGILKPEIFNER